MVTEWRLLKADPLLLARLPGGQGPLLHPLADDPSQLALGVIIQLVVHLLVDVLQQPVDKNLTQQTLLLLDLSLWWLLLQGWWQHLLLELLKCVHVEVYVGRSSMVYCSFIHRWSIQAGCGWGWLQLPVPRKHQNICWWLHSLLWAGSGVAAAVARCLLATGRKSQFIRSSEQQSRI